MTAASRHIGPVQIPALAVGTMYFGTRVRLDAAFACLDRAFEVGARFWDTANNYAAWAGGTGDESEKTIGAWLARRGAAVREQVVLATKIGARLRTAGTGFEHALGLSAAAVASQVDDSLRRLGVDQVDVLYAHIDDPTTPLPETLDALGRVVEQGKARTIAASNLTLARLQEAVAAPTTERYRALQQRFSYLMPDPTVDLWPQVALDDGILALCRSDGIVPLGYSPLLSGAYTVPGRAFPEGYSAPVTALDQLREVAQHHDIDAGQAVLAWMVGRTDPVVPVIGASRPEQIVSAWDAVHTRLDTAELAALDTARRG